MMIINNQKNITNFSGIYRLPKTVQNISDIERHVAPMYQYLKHEPILIFEGNSKNNLIIFSHLPCLSRHNALMTFLNPNWLQLPREFV